MIQDMDFVTFMERAKRGRINGDSRTKIRFVETQDDFTLCYAETDGFVNRTVYAKEAILTASRLDATNIDVKREIDAWKMEYLRDAIDGSGFIN